MRKVKEIVGPGSTTLKDKTEVTRSSSQLRLRATGSLAQNTKNEWEDRFKLKLEQLGIKVWLIVKYVDDILVVVSNLPLGTREVNGKLVISQEGLEEDIKCNRTKQEVTIEILRTEASKLIEFLQFTAVSCLDTQLWWGEPGDKKPWFNHDKEGEVVPGDHETGSHGQIMYKFYKKSVSNPLTILHRSAMPQSVKIATFSNEVLRRLKTTHVGLDQEEVESILVALMDDLTEMGYYKLEWRENILKASVTGYMRILNKVRLGETARNRKGAATRKTRRFQKLIGIQEWFRVDHGKQDTWEVEPEHDRKGKGRNLKKGRSKQDDRYIESVMSIPHTPESELKRRLTQLESRLGLTTRFKYCESMGRTIRELLVRKDP